MLVRVPQFRSPTLPVALLVLGLLLEAAVFFVGNYWARRYSPDAPTLGPILLVLSSAGIYLSTQILHLFYAIPPVAGASLSLLAAMLAWVGLALLVIWFALAVALALSALVIVPARLVVDLAGPKGRKPTSAHRPAR